jgi:hypothetical protein
MPEFFDIPLNLPHAGTIAMRIQRFLQQRSGSEPEGYDELLDKAEELVDLLVSSSAAGDNPPEPRATEVRDAAAALGREIVALVETLDIRHDRLGQFVRNLFECLELGEEGASISLRAGEDPASLQRPV